MAKSELLELIDRYLHGEVTPQEKLKIETWLDVMKTDKSIPHVLTEDEKDVLARKLMSEVDNIDEIKAFRPKGIPNDFLEPKRKSHPIFFDRSFRIAASILILIAVSATFFLLQRNNGQEELGGGGEKRILSDGSIVWLKKGSTLKFSQTSDNNFRIASLSGEGLFEVAKDQARPFKILCGEIQILVTGTSFNLKTTSEGIDLHLFTGHVNLSSKNMAESLNVDPKQHVIFTRLSPPTISSIDDGDIEKIIGNSDYLMAFKDAPLNEIFTKLEHKFDVKITVENPQMKKCRIKVDLTDKSLEKSLTLLKAQLDLDFKINGNAVDVTGSGCNQTEP